MKPTRAWPPAAWFSPVCPNPRRIPAAQSPALAFVAPITLSLSLAAHTTHALPANVLGVPELPWGIYVLRDALLAVESGPAVASGILMSTLGRRAATGAASMLSRVVLLSGSAGAVLLRERNRLRQRP